MSFDEIFGEMSPEEVAEAKAKRAERQARKNASHFQCAIPDWTGQGGMVHFWINEDGSYECEDSRLTDSMIREGVRRFANDS